jgi:hypothetical protein
MRQAAEAIEFAYEEQVTVTACVVRLMDCDIADYEARGKDPPDRAKAIRQAGRKALRELAPDGTKTYESHSLESMSYLRPRLSEIDDTAKGLAMLVELCACQPWFAMEHPKRLRDEPREGFLEQVAILLGGDTTQEDVAEIDKIIYRRELKDWLKILIPIIGGVGIGLVTAGFAAPMIGGVIGGWMGLGGAAAVNAGLATLGGGSLAAGGLGMAGGTALIGGVGATIGGGAGLAAGKVAAGDGPSRAPGEEAQLAASLELLLDDRFPVPAVKFEGRKLEAFVERLKVHGQSSQAKAQQVVNRLSEQIEGLNQELNRERSKTTAQAKRIEELEKKIDVLNDALDRMNRPG